MSTIIAVVGSHMIDFITYSSRLPKSGETLVGGKYEQGFGGKGANQCVTASRLGASTVFITSLGNDDLGKKYLEKLKNENIDVSHVKIKEDHSGVAQITVTEKGENAIIVVQGANKLLSSNDVIEVKETIQSASVLICQFEISLETTLEALKVFKGHGTSIVNGAPAVKDVHQDILKLCDIFCVNETEAEVMTEIENLTISNAQEAIDKLVSFGCNTVIITFGAEGAVYATPENKNIVHIPVESVAAVDTTGAGDSFVGSLAYFIAYHKNLSLDECIRRSSRIATKTVQKPGTQSSFPFRTELPDEIFS